MQRKVAVSVGLLVAVYVAVTAGVIVLASNGLRAIAWQLTESTARLVGHEIVSALSESVADGLAVDGSAQQRHLLDDLKQLESRSATVRSATLVGPSGEIVATTKAGDPQEVREPAALFGTDARSRVRTQRRSDLRTGLFVVEIPFMQSGEPYAYAVLELQSTSVAELYAVTYRVIWISTALALIVISALILTLHLQYRRRQSMAARIVRDAIAGMPNREVRVDPILRPVLDAAERVRTELEMERARVEEVRDSLTRLDRSLQVGLIVLGPDRKVAHAGERACGLLGIDPAAEDRRERASQQLAPVLEALERAPGEAIELEVEIELGEKAPPRWLQVNVAPTQAAEASVIVEIRDRAEIEALERDLLEAAVLRGLRHSFLGLAHDLKAPVNAVVLNLESLRSKMERSELTAGARESAERTFVILREELQRLQEIVDRLLSTTAPASELPERFSLTGLIQEVVRLLTARSRQQEVALDAELPDAEVAVVGRRGRIRQALMNVVVNALEELGDGGRIELELSVDSGVARVRCADTGGGIPGDVRERLFDLRVTSKTSGTGIGLYVARAVLEEIGGTIEVVESGPDGTVIDLHIPIAGASDDG